MRSEGYGSRPVCVCVCVCVCVSVCPGLASATHATTRPSRHTYGLSIVLAPEVIWRFSYNGLVSKIAVALPYSRAHGGLRETGSFSAFLPYSTTLFFLNVHKQLFFFTTKKQEEESERKNKNKKQKTKKQRQQ